MTEGPVWDCSKATLFCTLGQTPEIINELGNKSGRPPQLKLDIVYW